VVYGCPAGVCLADARQGISTSVSSVLRQILFIFAGFSTLSNSKLYVSVPVLPMGTLSTGVLDMCTKNLYVPHFSSSTANPPQKTFLVRIILSETSQS
jgi:hypothetical protein